MTPLTLPFPPERARQLHVGDEVLLRGRIVTARDAAHRHLLEREDAKLREWLRDSVLYHCGPVVAREPRTGEWRFVAAGPSTSMREEPYEAEIIARYGIRGILGKGGMGARTLEALGAAGAVYLHTAGGLAVTLARRVTKVIDVHMLDELGAPEAIWLVEVKDFPAIVSMDAHGNSLHGHRDSESARVAEAPMDLQPG